MQCNLLDNVFSSTICGWLAKIHKTYYIDSVNIYNIHIVMCVSLISTHEKNFCYLVWNVVMHQQTKFTSAINFFLPFNSCLRIDYHFVFLFSLVYKMIFCYSWRRIGSMSVKHSARSIALIAYTNDGMIKNYLKQKSWKRKQEKNNFFVHFDMSLIMSF